MAASKATLFDIRGQVRSVRQGVSTTLIDRWINARVREVLNKRTYWCDLVVRGVLAVPNAWTQGTVSLTSGGLQVIGNGTNWPVADQVNTVIRDGIFERGNQEVFPASMDGIRPDSILYVDAAGVPEIVSVNRVTDVSFWATFLQPHNQYATITQSTLAGRQFRTGAECPIFDVMAVTDPQTLVIDVPWGNASVANLKYQIAGMYYTIVPNIRKFNYVVDRQQGIPLVTNVNVAKLNWQDPQRTASGDPEALADLGASRNGIPLYELWPTQLTARQIDWMVYQDWPELVNDTDRLPWFLDPEIFVCGVLSNAYRYRASREDYQYDPQAANFYEKKFSDLVELAMNADESKMQQDLESQVPLGLGGGPGTLYFQTHVNGYGGDWSREL